jgi:dihydrofolate reductase
MQESISRYMKGGWSLLVGRTTYEDLYEGWQVRQPSHPMTSALARTQKFVATRDANRRLPWGNSTLVAGEATETVAKLKREHDKTLVIFGSAVLVRALLQRGLVDEFLLMIHPLVLGEGLRLFDQGTALTKLKLVDEVRTKTGVMVVTYGAISDR